LLLPAHPSSRPDRSTRGQRSAGLRAAALLFIALCIGAQAWSQASRELLRQQAACPANDPTSLSGKVYAPNGIDPLPNVIVYVPSAPVAPFTPGVSCASADQQVSGAPLASATTAADGSFTLQGVPAGANIPLVVQAGRWRRQVVIPDVPACANTAVPATLTHLPTSQAEGDIPRIAMVTGYADGLECVLRKIGIADSEFTNPGGLGHISIFKGSGDPGAIVDANTPAEDQLESTQAALNNYDMVMFGCQGGQYLPPSAYQTNLIDYVNAGGRILLTHFGYVWLYNDTPFSETAEWDVDQPHDFTSDPETANVVETLPNGSPYPDGIQLAEWLKDVGASTTAGQITIGTLRKDQNGVNPPTQPWLSITDQNYTNSIMQFTFNTPVGTAAANQCGRVMFNEYHVEDQMLTYPTVFPAECSSGPMTSQEKLLEFSLFNLSSFLTTGVPPTVTVTATNSPLKFKQGDSSDTVTLNIANTGATVAATPSLMVTVALPAGLSAKAIQGAHAGTGWACTLAKLTCTRTTSLDAGASDPVTLAVSVASSAPAGSGASIVATVAGGGLLAAVTGVDPVTIVGHPTITWPTPAAIVYGKPLGGAQLDASTAVPGTFAYSPAAGKVLPAGSQTISVTFTPADEADYTVTTAKVTLLVKPAQLIVSAHSASRAYGKPNPPLTYTLSGFVNGDTAATATTGKPDLATSATVKSSVGSYPIVATAGTLKAGNYTFKLVPGILTVTKAPLTITASNASAIYNQPLPAFTYSAAGFVNGDSKSVLSGKPAESTTAKQGSPAGTYPIAIARGTLKATNYSFVFKNGTLTIKSN